MFVRSAPSIWNAISHFTRSISELYSTARTPSTTTFIVGSEVTTGGAYEPFDPICGAALLIYTLYFLHIRSRVSDHLSDAIKHFTGFSPEVFPPPLHGVDFSDFTLPPPHGGLINTGFGFPRT
jgi:hypothetical protein